MNETRPHIVASVKQDVVAAVKGTGDIAKAVLDTIAATFSTALRDTAHVGVAGTEAITHIAGGVIHGATEVGGDVGAAARGAVIGILRGTKATGAEAVTTISHTASSVIKHTSEVGGDLGAAATGLVEGAIHSARDVGLTGEEAASAAGTAAVEAANKLGTAAGNSVRGAVTGTISGVKVVLKEPSRATT